MIRLQRRRGMAQVPKSFQQPKLKAAAAKLATIYFTGLATGEREFPSSAWKPAKGALKKDTGGKCAYCEASTDVVAHGDVEHFRPKSIYWWLAFAFDNYLFSCQICNQTFKGDKFPISGVPAVAPAMPAAAPIGPALDALLDILIFDATLVDDLHVAALWAGEDADLPHPYFEDPEPLLRYEVDDPNQEVWIRSAGGARADRAAAAMDAVLGLNREELRKLRYIDYRTFAVFRAVLMGNIDPTVRQSVTSEIRVQQGRRQPFAGMKRYFARGWGLPGPF